MMADTTTSTRRCYRRRKWFYSHEAAEPKFLQGMLASGYEGTRETTSACATPWAERRLQVDNFAHEMPTTRSSRTRARSASRDEPNAFRTGHHLPRGTAGATGHGRANAYGLRAYQEVEDRIEGIV